MSLKKPLLQSYASNSLGDVDESLSNLNDPSRWREYQSDSKISYIEIPGINGNSSFSIALQMRCRGPSQAYVDKVAKCLLNEHVSLQLENIKKCLEHEVNNSFNGNLSKAIEVIQFRTYEAYTCWCEKHFLETLDLRHPYAEILLYRVVESIAEHILYCPERIAQVVHSILECQKGNDPYIIDRFFLHRGLDRVHACESDILNFDDINQCGSMNTKTLRKAWHESVSVAVCIDILRMYYPVFFVKAWVFALSLWVKNIYMDDPLFNNKEYWETVIMFDVWMYFGVEVLLYIYSFWIQERGQSWIRRSWQRMVGVLLSIISILWFRYTPTDSISYFIFIVFGRIFLFIIYLPMVERWLGRDRNFVKYGRPKWARTKLRQTILRPKLNEISYENSDDGLGITKSTSLHVLRHSLIEGDEFNYDRLNCCSSLQYLICTPCRQLRLINGQAILFWMIVAGLTFVFEHNLVGPIVLGYTFKPLCANPENPACPNNNKLSDVNWTGESRCVACGMGLITIYLLLSFSCMIDLYLIFNFVLSLFGFFKGLSRGVAGLLIKPSKFSTRLWRGQDKSLLPKAASLMHSDDDSRFDSEYLGSISPVERRKIEKSQSNTRLAFIRLFGTWIHALEVWSTICSSLYQRDLISFQESKDLRACFDRPKKVPGRRNRAKSFAVQKTKELVDLLSGMSAEPQGRILFFLKTIGILGKSDRWFNNVKYDAQEYLEKIPTLSQIITTYTEDIMKSAQFLREKTGEKSNLEHLINRYKGEWRLFEQRMIHEGLFKDKNIHQAKIRNSSLLTIFLDCNSDISEKLIDEIRLWSSYRAQTVSRTMRGALVYHDALAVLIRWAHEDCDEQKTQGRKILSRNDMVELIVSAQTYGARPDGNARRKDLEWLINKWKDYPIAIVYDFDKSSQSRDNYHPDDLRDINQYWSDTYGMDGKKSTMEGQFPFDYATCVKKIVDGKLQLVNVLPRSWPFRLGKGKQKIQGKASNHLNASRKLWGHVTQVLDANMDGFIGEGFKLPFITHQFLSKTNTGRKTVSSRKNVLYRIIGFREYIYTHRLGGVAGVMAATESTFGTICQRTLDDPLGVRMHYGHPDFFDTFWILNRGGPSKASPGINLSEDVFAGFNAWLRGENTLHVDTLEWQKGRETVFTTASMFLTKISAGMVGALRSRDMMDMHAGLGILTRFSLWCSSTGYWLTLVLLSLSLQLYAVIFFFFSVADVSKSEMQLLDSTVSVQWVLGFGFVTALPFLAEQLLERHIAGVWIWLKLWPLSTLFYLFQNQAIAASVLNGLKTGVAQYINTGRPSFFNSYTKELAYRLYVKSHYYPCLTVIWLYSYHIAIAISNKSSDDSKFDLFVVACIVSFWLIAPVVFCPQTTDITAMKKDWLLTAKFVIYLEKCDDKLQDSLYTFWKHDYQEKHDLNSLPSRFTGLVMRIFLFILLLMLDTRQKAFYGGYAALLFSYLFFTGMWKLMPKSDILNIIWMNAPIIVVIILPQLSGVFEALNVVFIGALSGDWEAKSLIRVVVFVIGIRVVEDSFLFISSIICRFCIKKKQLRSNENDERSNKIRSVYKRIVEVFYLLGFHYHIHLYLAILVFLLQAFVQIIIIIFGQIYKWAIKPVFTRFGIGVDNRYKNLSNDKKFGKDVPTTYTFAPPRIAFGKSTSINSAAGTKSVEWKS